MIDVVYIIYSLLYYLQIVVNSDTNLEISAYIYYYFSFRNIYSFKISLHHSYHNIYDSVCCGYYQFSSSTHNYEIRIFSICSFEDILHNTFWGNIHRYILTSWFFVKFEIYFVFHQTLIVIYCKKTFSVLTDFYGYSLFVVLSLFWID